MYVFKSDGEGEDDYAILDTAGLCDTEVTANQDVGMQELLINSVAATVAMYNLEVVSFLMCVDLAGRLPGNFGEVWPQVQDALGGERLADICHFVVTKANGGSKILRKKLVRLPEQPFYEKLVHSSLGWPVTHAGKENLDGLKKLLLPTTTKQGGINASSVDASSASLKTKKNSAGEVLKKLQAANTRLAEMEGSCEDYVEAMDSMQQDIQDAYEKLSSLGWCSDNEKARIRSLIDQKPGQLKKMKRRLP